MYVYLCIYFQIVVLLYVWSTVHQQETIEHISHTWRVLPGDGRDAACGCGRVGDGLQPSRFPLGLGRRGGEAEEEERREREDGGGERAPTPVAMAALCRLWM